MTYAEKLKDSRWKIKRTQIIKRDKSKCLLCGEKTDKPEVHHVFYIPNVEPWEYPSKMLQTLCHDCHDYITFYGKPNYKKCLDFIKQSTFIPDDSANWCQLLVTHKKEVLDILKKFYPEEYF